MLKLLDKDGPGRVKLQGKLGIFKGNQPGLRILLSSHESWSHLTCLFTGLLSHRRGPGAGVSSLNPQWWGAKLYLQPQALHSEMSPGDPAGANQIQWHKQGQEQMVGCPWTAWRKRQQQDKVIVWIGACPQGHSWPRHSQRTQPALSILQSTTTVQSTRCLN